MFDHARRTGFAYLDHDFCETVNKGHGRIETRRCWAVSDPDYINYVNDRQGWHRLTSMVMVESERLVDGKTTKQVRYYISSLPIRAETLLAAVRGHWGHRELSPLGAFGTSEQVYVLSWTLYKV